MPAPRIRAAVLMLWTALLLWCLLWARVGLPWRSFQPQPSFTRVEVVPSFDGRVVPQVLNVLAFVPVGFIGTRLGWRPVTIILVAAGISGATEVSQLFSSRRYPTLSDLILNTAGAAIGLAVPRVWTRR